MISGNNGINSWIWPGLKEINIKKQVVAKWFRKFKNFIHIKGVFFSESQAVPWLKNFFICLDFLIGSNSLCLDFCLLINLLCKDPGFARGKIQKCSFSPFSLQLSFSPFSLQLSFSPFSSSSNFFTIEQQPIVRLVRVAKAILFKSSQFSNV